MKRNIIALFVLLSSITLSAQQDKRVYITLDVSGSMTGNKYILANYTTQMIVTLCDDDDEVSMIVYGVEKNLSKEKSPLQPIQKPMEKFVFGRPTSTISQFEDIKAFNNLYKPSPKKQDWLFVIGDGMWGTEQPSYDRDREKFQKIVEGGTLNVCYLQTGESLNENNDFTDFAESLGVIDIGKSSTKSSTIKEGCNHFARKILGFSKTPLDIKNDGSKTIKVVAELPIKEFLLVYQDDVTPAQLPKIVNAQSGGNKLDVKHKGTPTTNSLSNSNKMRELSGNVWRIQAGNPIPPKTAITIEFDKNVSTKNVNIYPLVEDIEFGSVGFTRVGGGLIQVDDKTFGICQDEKTALVRIELNEKSKEHIPEELLKNTKVVVKANNKEYSAKYNNGGFECTIDLMGEKTQYYAECDCPGYFNRVTPIMTIVRDKKHCGPVVPPEPAVQRKKEVDFGTMTFDQLKKDPITGSMHDSESLETLDPSKFDLSVEMENGFLYDEPSVSVQGNTIAIDVHPRGDWCECLFPRDLNITLVSTPKPGAFEATDKNYVRTEHPIHLQIEKGRPWMARCFWVIMALLGLVALFFYLRALQRKRRFKKNAAVTPTYYDYYGKKQEMGSQYLRKEGFGAWFARWFLPGDERNTLSFDSPQVSLRFVAAESNDVVNLPKDGNIDPEKMHISGYNPKRDTNPKEPVQLGNQGKISITKDDGSDEGYLVFTSGEQTDGNLYRLFVALLIAATVVSFLVLSYLLIKSFF